MEPFALLKMMGTFVTGGITGRIVLYLLLLAAGAISGRPWASAPGCGSCARSSWTSARCMKCRSACSAPPPLWVRWA